MMHTLRNNGNRKSLGAAVSAALLCGVALAPGVTPAFAQTTTAHPKNFIQKHPTMTGIGAGIATHHALKVAAKNAKLHHKKLNWAERHPTLSAIGVGAGTRAVIKKTTPK